jgi:steroid delta-isomerase-like uncharacterized protein
MKKLFYLAIISCLFTACMKDMSMDHSTAYKEKTQRFYDEVINAHNIAAIDSFCTADFVDHNPDQGHSGKGIDDLKAGFRDFFAAYPDIHATTKFMVAHGDTVVSYVTMTGTNSGAMGNKPATNKQVNIDGIDIIAIKDGKAVERWGIFDSMKMMQQLGMMNMGGSMPDSTHMANKMDEKK